MGWSGGTYTKGNAGSGGWAGDASLGIGIEASRHDTQDNDFATGINNCLTKDGQNTPTANLGMGGYKHTGVGNATAADEYLSYGQLLDVSKAVTTAGTVPNYTVTLTPAPAAYVDGMSFCIQIHSTLNVSGATLDVNGLGAKDLKITKVGATTRDPFPAELSSRNTYLVAYSSVLDAFTIANPTFGTDVVGYTPTVGSSAGTLALGGSNDCWYQYIGARLIRVHLQLQLGLSGSTASDLYVSLPFPVYNQDWNTFGIGYVTGVASYSSYGAEALINTSDQITIRRTDQANFPIDSNFFFYGTMFYMRD
jgi:hypothetical protein